MFSLVFNMDLHQLHQGKYLTWSCEMLQPGALFGNNSMRTERVNNTVQLLLYNQRKEIKSKSMLNKL